VSDDVVYDLIPIVTPVVISGPPVKEEWEKDLVNAVADGVCKDNALLKSLRKTMSKGHDQERCASCGKRRDQHRGKKSCPRFVSPKVRSYMDDPLSGSNPVMAGGAGPAELKTDSAQSSTVTKEQLMKEFAPLVMNEVTRAVADVHAQYQRTFGYYKSKIDALERTLANYSMNVRIEKAIHEPIDWTTVRDEAENLTEEEPHHGFPIKLRVVF
jgi:hypothetical protein